MSDLLGALRTVVQLKSVKRQGWIDRGMVRGEVESVADHTFGVAIIAWLIALDDPELDADRVLKLAIVHDVAEALIGDRTPYAAGEIPDASDRAAFDAFFATRKQASDAETVVKRRLEAEAVETLAAMLPAESASTVRDLLQEYEGRSTPEARFVKDVDRFEAFLQSRAYATSHPDVPLAGFTDMAIQGLETPRLQRLRDEMLAEDSD